MLEKDLDEIIRKYEAHVPEGAVPAWILPPLSCTFLQEVAAHLPAGNLDANRWVRFGKSPMSCGSGSSPSSRSSGPRSRPDGRSLIGGRYSTRSSSGCAAVASGTCCRTNCSPRAPSGNTSRSGATTGPGSGSSTPCAGRSARPHWCVGFERGFERGLRAHRGEKRRLVSQR